jgi:short-subunit dehydrogenase
MPKRSKTIGTRTRTALVTGASSGIGKAVAGELLRAGVEVYGTSRDPGRAGADGLVGIRWLAFDGGTAEGVEGFIRENRELLGGLDLLINNAGWGWFGSLAETPAEAVGQQLHLLLEAPIRLTQAVLPGMQARKNGAILNVSSLAAIFPLPFMAAYSAGKAGLSAFTQSLILSEGDTGVVLIDFQAGDFRTAFNERMSRQETLGPKEAAAWQQIERHLQSAPGAEVAASDMIRALERGRSGMVRSGGAFQKWIAPLGVRVLPAACLLRAIRWYYKLP